MKISNERLVESTGVFSKLVNLDLPIKVSFLISKNAKKIQSELEVYDAEKQKLIDKYSIKAEDGTTKVNEDGTITINQEFIDDWNKDIVDLLQCENDIDLILIDSNDLFNCNCNITPRELMLIDYMFN